MMQRLPALAILLTLVLVACDTTSQVSQVEPPPTSSPTDVSPPPQSPAAANEASPEKNYPPCHGRFCRRWRHPHREPERRQRYGSHGVYRLARICRSTRPGIHRTATRTAPQRNGYHYPPSGYRPLWSHRWEGL